MQPVEQTTVLMVEDDELLLEFFDAVLSGEHQVLTATSIEQAKQILGAQKVDAIFCDLRLGRDSGLDLLGWIQFNQPELLTCTTILSGEKISRPGGFDVPVVTKPVEPDELLEIASRATSRSNVSSPA